MSQRSSLYRTLEIIERLNNSQILCIDILAQEYGVSERTIWRDFELIRNIFGDFVTKDKDCYRAYDTMILDRVLNATDLMTLANIVNLFDVTKNQSQISDKTKELVKRSMSVYDFKSRPFEVIENYDIVKILEHAIKFNKEIELEYKTERVLTKIKLEPYKILFLNENFYIIGVISSKRKVEFRRIGMIESIAYTKKSFRTDAKVTNFIKKIQTPWANFDSREVRVRLRADVKIRRYFMRKKYLPSQKIVKTYDNGDIEVHYEITNYREIEDLIIKWLPNIEILEPRNLKRFIKRTLSKKMHSLTQFRVDDKI